MKLYEIADQYLEALERLQESEELDAQTIADTLEGLSGEVEEKMRAVAAVTLNMSAQSDSIESVIDKLIERQSRIDKKACQLRLYLQQTMERLNMSVVHGELYDLKIKKNPPSTVIRSEEEIPEKYWTITEPTKKLNVKKIKESLLAGVVVPGTELVSNKRLEIK